MPNYESTFICSPETPAEKIEELTEKAKKLIESNGGKVTLVQNLGKKRLAYPINKIREGSYVYFEITAPGVIVSALENLYKVNEPIIRSLTVKVEKKAPPKPVVVVAPEATPEVAVEVKADAEPKTVEVKTDGDKQS